MRLRQPGFTLVDLVITLVMAVILLAVLMPTMHGVASGALRVQCASNLRQIGQAMMLYSNENSGAYPRTRWDGNDATPTEYTRYPATDPFAVDGPRPNDVTAALFLLLRTQDITSAVFICPSDTALAWDEGGQTSQSWSNFPDGGYLSYSLQNPYPSESAVKRGFRWNNTIPAAFALAADANPGTPEVLTVTPYSSFQGGSYANSSNHERNGQNVLYGDLHVDFCQTPFSGVSLDNIYGVGKLKPDGKIDPMAYSISGSPAHANDSVLLPVAMGRPVHPRPGFSWDIRGYTYFSALLFIVVVATFFWAVVSPRSRHLGDAD